MSLIPLALFTGLFYKTDAWVYFTHHDSHVCVNVILLSIWPSSNLKTRAYEREISEVLWTKRIEQSIRGGGRETHKPEETGGPSHPGEDTDLIKMAAEWWHDGQHWLKALRCMTRKNPGCEGILLLSRSLSPSISIPYIPTSHSSNPRPLNTWIGSVDVSPLPTHNRSR